MNNKKTPSRAQTYQKFPPHVARAINKKVALVVEEKKVSKFDRLKNIPLKFWK